MASQEAFYQELSPRSQKIIAKHKLHEMESNQWDYLMAKPNPEDHSHCIVCRATDLEWNYDIDRFSRNLWSHKKNSSRKTSPISTKSKDRKSPLNFNDSPTKTSPARRARSTSIGEKTDLSSSPIKRGVTFNQEGESGQADQGYYNIQEGHKSVVTTSIPEKKVLDELYQIYSNSQNNGNEHINIIENGQAFNPFQTPRKELFAKSPAKVVERNSAPKEYNFSNNYFQTFSPFNVKQQESHRSNQEFDIRASLDTINGEFKLQSEKSLSSQQTGRRSRNDRKKLKEEKNQAKIIVTEPCDQQQESENWTSFKSFDKDDGSNEQTMVQREEKVKERRMRKDRLKKGDLNGEERKVDSYNNNLASREILPDKYSESNIEFETENFHNHSFLQKNDKRMSQVVPEYSDYLSRNQISEDNQGQNNIPGTSRGSFSEHNIQKDFLSPFRGKGFAGYKLPINESRTFVDTERDICSTARKEDLKGENGSSHDKAMIKSSNRDSDSRKQIESLPLKRSEKFLEDVLPNEEEAEEVHDDAYERIMTRFLNQEPKASSGSIKQTSSANDEGQELENFMEIENQLMLESIPQDDAAELQTTIKEEIKQPDQQDFDIKTTEKEMADEIQENKQDPENVEKEDEFENKYPEFEEILKKALPLAEALNKKEKKSSVDEHDHIFVHPKEVFGKRNESKDKLVLNNENEKDQMIAPPVEKRRKSKPTVFNTNITWEKLRLFRKVEQKAANKIQDFYSNKPKETAQLNHGNNQVKGISEDEFQSLIETMKKHEDLYHKMKQGLNNKGEKGEDLVNLSIAFISAYCSLKDN